MDFLVMQLISYKVHGICFDADHGFNSFQIKALNTEKLFPAIMFTTEVATIARTQSIK